MNGHPEIIISPIEQCLPEQSLPDGIHNQLVYFDASWLMLLAHLAQSILCEYNWQINALLISTYNL